MIKMTSPTIDFAWIHYVPTFRTLDGLLIWNHCWHDDSAVLQRTEWHVV